MFPRLGEQRLWHFAHINSEIDCPLKSEDAALFRARAILYEWLRSKYHSKVFIEKTLEESPLPRPLDCWVETSNGRKFAYWILNKQLKEGERSQLKAIQENGIFLHLIVLNKFLRIKSEDRLVIKLSSTERDLMTESDYSLIYKNPYDYEKYSLTYLDIFDGKITVYRNLNLIEGASNFRGFPIVENIENCLISPKNGEFVFDGEFDTLAGK